MAGQSAGQVLGGGGKGGSGWSELGLSFKLSVGIVFANMVRYING